MAGTTGAAQVSEDRDEEDRDEEAMKKKTIKLKTVWCVVVDDGYLCSFNTFDEAKNEAEARIEKDETAEVKILQVVQAWEIHWPEEPSPEIWEIGLDQL